MMSLVDYLAQPIPRYKALLGVGFAFSTTAITYFTAKSLYEETVKDSSERLKILLESTQFLMEHADNETIRELDKNLDFWRIIRGVPTDGTEEE